MAKKHGLAKRILDGADAFASLFSGGELAVLGAFAALLGGSVMRRSRYRRLTRRRVRQQFDRTIARICAALAEEAQSVARDTLVHAYEATAEEISAFAEEVAADSERMQREMTQIVDDLARQINNSVEIELRHMRRDTDDVYRQVIEQVRGDWLSPGNASKLNAEVQNALNEFAGRGVTGFTDKAGRRWGLYEYANMAMRTAIHRAGLQATIDAMRASGYDLAYITRHPGACPLCERWYGTILSISGNDPTHPSLQGAMDQGLFHPNCADVLQVYFPGVSDLTAGMGEYTPEQSAERYAASQRQRALEREIRKWKRMQAAAIAPEQERVAKAHIDRLQRQLRALTGETKLPRRYDREGGRVRLSEAARKIKPFTIDENGSIISLSVERKTTANGQRIPAMPKKRLQKIVKGFKRKGGMVMVSKETDEYLEKLQATGVTLQSDLILLHSNPSRATVFEELIHSAQYRDGKIDGSALSIVLCEIEAKEKLIRCAKAYRLSEAEILETKALLQKEYERLAMLQGGGTA